MNKEVSPGRPPATIDWKLVDKLLVGGANGVQIAGHLGIHPETLYRRCESDNNVGFTEYSQAKSSSGEALLHLAQFNKAMKGDSGMLKHLGEFRLGQKSINVKDIKHLSKEELHDAIREVENFRSGTGEASESSLETQPPVLDSRFPRQAYPIQNELGAEGAL